jgi:hemerythrin
MPLIKWDDSLFSVQNEEFDKHHKKLVDLINELHSAMMKRTGKEALRVILIELKKYTEYHFKAEEKQLLLVNYPDFESHKKQHTDFVQELETLIRNYEWGKREVGIDTMEFLKEWLFKHIQMSDKKYTPYLKK